jgi:hypothetical protein
LKAAPIVPTVRRLFNKKMRRTSSAAFFILSIRQVRRHFAKTRLKRVLEARRPAYSGYHLWYPSHRQPSRRLRAAGRCVTPSGLERANRPSVPVEKSSCRSTAGNAVGKLPVFSCRRWSRMSIVIGSMRSSERVGLDASSSVTHQHRGFRVCQHLICDTAEHNCG